MGYRVESMDSIPLLGKAERQWAGDVQAARFWDTCKEDGTLAALTEHSTSPHKEHIGIADAASFDGSGYLYYIATPYSGENVPDGYVLITLPASLWVKVGCASLGAENTANKEIWTRVYSGFFPTSGYEPSGYQLEVYPRGDGSYPDELSEIWISVRKNQKGSGENQRQKHRLPGAEGKL